MSIAMDDTSLTSLAREEAEQLLRLRPWSAAASSSPTGPAARS
ncbi:hypothetical protein [Streptomyces sp. B27]|nr:hypothetical protein [Streptomyces sp. B27]